MAAALFLLNGGNFVQARHVPAALERSCQPHIQDVERQRGCNQAGAQGQDIGVVVLPGQPGGVLVMTEGRARAMDFVGCDLLALAAAAKNGG